MSLAIDIRVKLLFAIAPGEIRRLLLPDGTGLAYAEDGDEGQLSVSRKQEYPSSGQVEVVQRAFAVAALAANRPILSWRVMEYATAVVTGETHYVIRLKVVFGVQEKLL